MHQTLFLKKCTEAVVLLSLLLLLLLLLLLFAACPCAFPHRTQIIHSSGPLHSWLAPLPTASSLAPASLGLLLLTATTRCCWQQQQPARAAAALSVGHCGAQAAIMATWSA
jgi:hypothetical protein